MPFLPSYIIGSIAETELSLRVDQHSLLVNGTAIGGLPSPPSSWFTAVIHGAIYTAAVEAEGKELDFQQLAVSHAAHDALAWAFQGTRQYTAVDEALRSVLGEIGIDQSSDEYEEAGSIGRSAAEQVAAKRVGDGLAHFVDYTHGPEDPGVYQQTPGGRPLPDTPQAAHLRPFGGIGDITEFRAPPPPDVTEEEYEKWVLEVKELGGLDSTERSEYDTDTAYFWRESSVTSVVRDTPQWYTSG